MLAIFHFLFFCVAVYLRVYCKDLSTYSVYWLLILIQGPFAVSPLKTMFNMLNISRRVLLYVSYKVGPTLSLYFTFCLLGELCTCGCIVRTFL